MREEILALLARIEQEQDVKILFAAESGSRAWGFASKDSDYDVRFIYVRPAREYARLIPHADVLDKNRGLAPICTDLLDFSGWDIRKACGLFANSNAAIMEWLDSPIIYVENGNFADSLRDLRNKTSVRKLTYSYASLARENYFRYIKDFDLVTYKKYLYVLRSLLCCRWINQFGTFPPTDFNKVMTAVECPQHIIDELCRIISIKAELDEADKQAGNPELNEFIENEIQQIQARIGGKGEMAEEIVDEKLLDPLIWKELGL